MNLKMKINLLLSLFAFTLSFVVFSGTANAAGCDPVSGVIKVGKTRTCTTPSAAYRTVNSIPLSSGLITVEIDANGGDQADGSYYGGSAESYWQRSNILIKGVADGGIRTRPLMTYKQGGTLFTSTNVGDIWDLQSSPAADSGDIGSITVDNIEFSWVLGGYNAGIHARCNSATTACYQKFIIKNCYFHHVKHGINTQDNQPVGLELEIYNTEVADTGYLNADGTSQYTASACIDSGVAHGIYVQRAKKFTLKNSFIHNSCGHLVKTRARDSVIENNRIFNGTGLEQDSAEIAMMSGSNNIEFPHGGTAAIIGNEFYKSEPEGDEAFIRFGFESFPNDGRVNSVYINNNTFVSDSKNSGGQFNSSLIKIGANYDSSNVAHAADLSITNNITNNLARIVNIWDGQNKAGKANLLNSSCSSTPTVTYTNQSTITCLNQDNTVSGALFVDIANKNYHLKSGSAGIDKSISATANLIPQNEYVHPVSSKPRVISGVSMDMGAFEYDGVVSDLQNAIIGLQVCAALNPLNIVLTGDANNDGKIGIEDVIFILQKVAGLR